MVWRPDLPRCNPFRLFRLLAIGLMLGLRLPADLHCAYPRRITSSTIKAAGDADALSRMPAIYNLDRHAITRSRMAAGVDAAARQKMSLGTFCCSVVFHSTVLTAKHSASGMAQGGKVPVGVWPAAWFLSGVAHGLALQRLPWFAAG